MSVADTALDELDERLPLDAVGLWEYLQGATRSLGSSFLSALGDVAERLVGPAPADLVGEISDLTEVLPCETCIHEVLWRRSENGTGAPAVTCAPLLAALSEPFDPRPEWIRSRRRAGGVDCSVWAPATPEAIAGHEARYLEERWLGQGQAGLFGD